MAWFEDAFWTHYLLVYGHRDDAQARAEVAWLRRRLPGLDAGRRVLDLACGPGRHLRAIRTAGMRTVGADLSADLLAEARRLGSGPLVRCDMRHLPFRDGVFDAVTIFFHSFGYFTTEAEDGAALLEAARVLAPGGGFLLDLMDADHVRRTLVARSERTAGPARIVEERWLADGGRRVEKRVMLREAGRERSWTESVRLYAPQEAEELAAAAGLRPAGREAGYGEEGAPRCLLLFRKGTP